MWLSMLCEGKEAVDEAFTYLFGVKQHRGNKMARRSHGELCHHLFVTPCFKASLCQTEALNGLHGVVIIYE